MPKSHLPHFTVVLLLLLLGPVLLGQSNKGDRFLKSENYAAALAAFQSGLQDPTDQPLSHHGLANLYVTSGYTKYSTDSAYYHITQAYETLRKLNYKQRGKIAKKLNTTIINKKRVAIEALAFDEAVEKQTLAGWQHFLTYIKKPRFKQRRLAETERNKLLYQEALEIHDTDHYEAVLKKYRKTLAERTRYIYDQLQMRVFEGRLSEQGWEFFDSLIVRYPNNPYAQDSMRTEYSGIHGTGNLQAFKKFAKQYPKSPFSNLATDSLFQLVMRTKKLEEYEFFLYSYPEHRQINSMWQQFYALYKIQRPRLKDLQYFQQKYTFFPYKEKLVDDVEDVIGQEAAYLAKNGTYENCRDFLQIYGRRANVGGLWQQLFHLYRERYPSVRDIDRFESTYRDFPFPEMIKEAKEAAISAEYQAAMASGNTHDAQQFIKTYPDYALVDSLWLHWYTQEKQQDPKAFQTFSSKKDFPFPDLLRRDSTTYEAEKERILFEFANQFNNLELYRNFLKEFPQSSFKEKLEKNYEKLVAVSFLATEITTFLGHYPKSKRRAEFLALLFERYQDQGDLTGLESLAANYPGEIPTAELQKAIKIARQSAVLKKGYYSKADHKTFDAFIKAAAPAENAYDALFLMISRDFRYQNWEKAAGGVLQYETYFGDKSKSYSQLVDLLTAPASSLKRTRFSSTINTRAQEFEGVLTADGNKLYFTGRGRRDNLGGEDIFVSERQDNGWTQPSLVSELSSVGDNESVESISTDGQEMILFKSGILHQSQQTENGWTPPTPLPDEVNQAPWQADARLTADGQALLFAAEKSNGDIDLYVCERGEGGNWSAPIHLGPMINTPEVERSPFLAADMRTLYFSSEGHVGMGKLDVFVSRRLDDSWTNWSLPKNLGRKLNTKDHDWGYRIHSDGKTLLYSAANGRNLDIYQFNLPDNVQPDQVSTVSGLVFSLDSLPLTATITWTNLETKEVISTQKTDPASGSFFTTLPEESLYGYTIQTKGYLPKSGSIDLRGGRDNLKVEEYLASIEEMIGNDYALPVSNLFFATGSFEIEPTSFPSLQALAEAIQAGNFKISINGHTDDVGSTQNNLLLSRKRAQALRTYLIDQGCKPKQLIAEGYGESQPIVPNDSEASRAKNRRVELKILD